MAESLSLERPKVVTQSSTEGLINAFNQLMDNHAGNSGLLDPLFMEVTPWDVVWELQDRIRTQGEDEGNFTRHALFDLVRRTEVVRSGMEVEAIAVLFQALGEQENRWSMERTGRLKGSIPIDIL